MLKNLYSNFVGVVCFMAEKLFVLDFPFLRLIVPMKGWSLRLQLLLNPKLASAISLQMSLSHLWALDLRPKNVFG